jgi:transcriptional regulator with XRE-family HTH domain
MREHRGVVVDAGALREIAEGAVAADPGLETVAPAQPPAEQEPEPFGVRLRAARTEAGLTQRELGSRTGLDQSVVSNLERGVHEPRLGTIERLADGLGLSTGLLLGGSGTTAVAPAEVDPEVSVPTDGDLQNPKLPEDTDDPEAASVRPRPASPDDSAESAGTAPRPPRRRLEPEISDLEIPPPLGDRPRRR